MAQPPPPGRDSSLSTLKGRPALLVCQRDIRPATLGLAPVVATPVRNWTPLATPSIELSCSIVTSCNRTDKDEPIG